MQRVTLSLLALARCDHEISEHYSFLTVNSNYLVSQCCPRLCVDILKSVDFSITFVFLQYLMGYLCCK